MSRIQAPQSVPPASQPLLDAVQKKMGMVPNMMKTLAGAPTVLEGYLAFSGTVGKSSLTAAQKEEIALAVGQVNGCQYCVSAHTLLASHAGISAEQAKEARSGRSSKPVDAAVLKFATQVVEKHGKVSDADVQAARSAGLTDGQVLEVVAATVLNILTNYLNNVAEPVIDFPVISLTI